MQSLIPVFYMIIGIVIFAVGFVAGRDYIRDSKYEPKQDGSFFMPVPTTMKKVEDAKPEPVSKTEVVENIKVNRFFD